MKSLVPQLDGSDLVRGCLGLLRLSHFSGFHWSWMTAPGANGLKKAAPTSVKGGRTRTLNWYPIGFDEPIGSLDTLRRFFFTLFLVGIYRLYRLYRCMRWTSNWGWAGNGVRLGAGSGDDETSELTRHGQGQGCNPNCMGLLHRKKSLKCWRPKCKRETESSFVSYTRRHSYKNIYIRMYTHI